MRLRNRGRVPEADVESADRRVQATDELASYRWRDSASLTPTMPRLLPPGAVRFQPLPRVAARDDFKNPEFSQEETEEIDWGRLSFRPYSPFPLLPPVKCFGFSGRNAALEKVRAGGDR